MKTKQKKNVKIRVVLSSQCAETVHNLLSTDMFYLQEYSREVTTLKSALSKAGIVPKIRHKS